MCVADRWNWLGSCRAAYFSICNAESSDFTAKNLLGNVKKLDLKDSKRIELAQDHFCCSRFILMMLNLHILAPKFN
jgi:hypothetical protein